jgi:hypothetical protein
MVSSARKLPHDSLSSRIEAESDFPPVESLSRILALPAHWAISADASSSGAGRIMKGGFEKRDVQVELTLSDLAKDEHARPDSS